MKSRLIPVFAFLFTAVHIFSPAVSGQEGWMNLTPYETLPGLYAVFALDTHDIWISGEAGKILHSTDGGISWDSLPSGTTEDLYTVEFTSTDTGWVAGDDDFSASTVLMTSNRGADWTPQVLQGGGAIPIYDIDFIPDENGGKPTGYITGGLGFTWKTGDNGGYWKPVRNNCENTFWSSCFVNQDTGWFVGTPSVAEPYTIMQTRDGGESWQQQVNPTGRNLRGVCFGTEEKGIAVGLVGTILYTMDGGETWEQSSMPGYIRWESVYLTSTGKAWAVGSRSSIAHSEDWGQSWQMQESGLDGDIELWEVFFIDDDTGWIVGGGIGKPGVILHTKNGGRAESSSIKHHSEAEVSLYPNPAYEWINIHISYKTFGTIEISDLNGRILLRELTSPGSNRIDISGFPEGVYIISIRSENRNTIRRFIKI